MRRRYAPLHIPHHLVHRGNDRCLVFLTDEDRRSYLACLAHACQKYACNVHAYVLMDNHVHLLATATVEGGLSRMMQWLGARHTTCINESRGRTGTLWQGRYFSSTVTSERYFLLCQRYIELNPVRAGMVTSAAEFSWSSFSYNALGHPNALLTEHEIYRRLGASTHARRTVYRELIESSLADSDVMAIRKAIQSRRPLADPEDAQPALRRGRPRKVGPEPLSGDEQLEIQL